MFILALSFCRNKILYKKGVTEIVVFLKCP